jgi:pyridoxine kinase
VPALQAKGHEVLALPTILLSFHPGHGAPAAQRIPATLMNDMLAKLHALGALADCSAVMTGYFAAPEQVEVAAAAIRSLRQSGGAELVLVDPVIGDDGALYVPEDVARAIRDQLLPLATIATPNAFELSWLSGRPAASEVASVAAARSLGPAEVIVTSVVGAKDKIATILVHDGSVVRHETPRLPHVPHGTGDYLAGCYLASRLQSAPEEAFAEALHRLERAIARSAPSEVLDVTG